MDNSQIFCTFRGYELMDSKNKVITSSMEDYLEMIYRVTKNNEYLKVGELAKLLHVKPSSSTKMVEKLINLGLINSKKYGLVSLSEEGTRIGEFLLNRHNIIEEFLNIISPNENTLVETELIEHHLSKNTIDSIKIFNEFININPKIYNDFINFKNKKLLPLNNK
ncbi:iron (metal) dependent repressor, DtxR family [Clostridium collagenovorans DSM 3089]|uniref:Manganese transport regulator n=1 Tax=Clostridium collagenovorans DSM 3089 TaxID=1121306 RepID=A0A1M5SKA3_9CLOT|nr:iron dependent repressor, metal binding and dimerization domain protein [Clostridium collagenovorans]SHH38974.1 iron (metal) dependent repressor, DtxR family [Clostridium collagenovorans DSM 3089]